VLLQSSKNKDYPGSGSLNKTYYTPFQKVWTLSILLVDV
jgi:hypothetical protein